MEPFWIQVGESFKKAQMEEWVFVSGDSSDRQNVMDFFVLHSTDHVDCIPETPRTSRQFDSLPWEPRGLKIRHHCLFYGHGQKETEVN